jgi:hypothetical protein
MLPKHFSNLDSEFAGAYDKRRFGEPFVTVSDPQRGIQCKTQYQQHADGQRREPDESSGTYPEQE